MNRSLTALGILLVLAGLTAAAVLTGEGGAPPQPPADDPAAMTAAPDAPATDAPALASGAVRIFRREERPPEEGPSRMLALPDGTFVATLNGAVDAAPLADYWGPQPYSPIIGIRSSAGVDWYEHADGSFSTTQMVWRSDLKRRAAMTRVAHPGPTPPDVGR